ncbi:YggS family pyridoxal phosphate-dependent enzyme [Lysobacter erysipheiresistens]|uniref:Pyridoxal phosphate homeostasis protein n=2 Tax=Novilysobacter erysipheiresistens TaxID=1749332 RepID=A0ABU7Z1G2_9GAMM
MNAISRMLDNAARDAGRPPPRLLAVSKTQPAAAVAALAALGQCAFGENYVQEAAAKQAELGRASPVSAGQEAPAGLEWHLIGHLQSNKAREAAALFDWVQTVDRAKLVAALARHRDPARGPLNVLVQVNIDDEASKHGCRPDEVEALAAAIAGEPMLRLRGLMVIPTPHDDPELGRPAFRRSRALFDALREHHPGVDTLSMGMSSDAAIAIAEGATMVRIGTALFGSRPAPPAAPSYTGR